MTGFALDGSVKIYQAMGHVTKAADFFLPGSFYLKQRLF
jgi:hypothetical protein